MVTSSSHLSFIEMSASTSDHSYEKVRLSAKNCRIKQNSKERVQLELSRETGICRLERVVMTNGIFWGGGGT